MRRDLALNLRGKLFYIEKIKGYSGGRVGNLAVRQVGEDVHANRSGHQLSPNFYHRGDDTESSNTI